MSADLRITQNALMPLFTIRFKFVVHTILMPELSDW